MKLPNWFKIVWWILLLVLTSVFLRFRWPDLTKGIASASDVLVLLVWFAVVLCPLFSEINIFGLKLKQEIQALKSHITQQIGSVVMQARSSVSMYVQQSSIQPAAAGLPEKASEELRRPPMEFKILKTLWTKQVNRFDDLSQVWSFRLNPSAVEFFAFRDAGTTLMKEGLVAETAHGQIHLTPPGFEYCKNHYKDFPDVQWWPEDPMKPERLKAVLGEG